MNKQAEISKNGGSSGGGGGAGGAGTKPKGSGEDVSLLGVFLLFFVHHEVGIQKLTHPYSLHRMLMRRNKSYVAH